MIGSNSSLRFSARCLLRWTNLVRCLDSKIWFVARPVLSPAVFSWFLFGVGLPESTEDLVSCTLCSLLTRFLFSGSFIYNSPWNTWRASNVMRLKNQALFLPFYFGFKGPPSCINEELHCPVRQSRVSTLFLMLFSSLLTRIRQFHSQTQSQSIPLLEHSHLSAWACACKWFRKLS